MIIVPQVVAPADTIRWAVLTIVVPAVSLVRHLLHLHHRDLHAERLAATIAAAAAPAARVWEIHMTVHLVTHAVHRHRRQQAHPAEKPVAITAGQAVAQADIVH